ncbi:hypothetical protein EG349_19155 [Chryseobacterium shandongense]|uniref:Uncharacterized protein n=1 Tax=Chryseobacterium shandongense TaxID=1493872 RepID=A0AAD0YGU8_9FLAO|nr:hypothetical protein [Chryseobacterium shandongense]AZA88739.1 hypothetical protein EG349_19155 [Chryseobacterium shandongense]AZA97281.1 hypothetical protein EG353_17870 [Chryseobacterium shandongense]
MNLQFSDEKVFYQELFRAFATRFLLVSAAAKAAAETSKKLKHAAQSRLGQSSFIIAFRQYSKHLS